MNQQQGGNQGLQQGQQGHHQEGNMAFFQGQGQGINLQNLLQLEEEENEGANIVVAQDLGQDEDMQANEENEEPGINPNEQWGILVAA